MSALRDILKGLLCGVLFVSAFFWSMVLYLIVNKSTETLVVVISPCLTNVIIGFLLAADSYRHILYKCLVSLPAAALTFFIYQKVDFIYYWLHRIWPEYGDLTAGGNFTVRFYAAFFCLCFIIAVVTAMALTRKHVKGFSRMSES